MRFLFLGPLPPPVTGHSIACRVLLEAIQVNNKETYVVNLSKPELISGWKSYSRYFSMFGILYDIMKNRENKEIFYLTISESIAGNIKDLAIYFILRANLGRLVIHLHGGSLKRDVLDKSAILRKLNTIFLKKVGAVVILGNSHRNIFAGIVSDDRIHIVQNFAEDEFFISADKKLPQRYSASGNLRILYLSNLVDGKGYDTLLDAIRLLPPVAHQNMVFDFAGAFSSDSDRARFIKAIEKLPNVRYHGVVSGPQKRDLLAASDVFCLPTELSEGQPISIIEAYASGCTVITTNRGGIPDVFAHDENGFYVEPRRPQQLAHLLLELLGKPELLSAIGNRNLSMAADRFRAQTYSERMEHILLQVDVAVEHIRRAH